MAEILKGAPVAAALTEKLKKDCDALAEKGLVPGLAIVRVGQRTEDISYERAALRRCAKVGIKARCFVLPENAAEQQLAELIDRINKDGSIHGCLLFRPLPAHMDERRICDMLRPEKDVDCMSDSSLIALFTGHGKGFAPCTAQSVMEILDYYGVELEGSEAAVIGRSLVIGRPLSMMLQNKNATVTMCHSKSRNIPELCRRAGIIVAAAGKAGMVDEEYVNEGQTVIDVGINETEEGGICGDVDFQAVEPVVRGISPVPGGVGAVTTAVLCKHVLEAAETLLSESEGAQV